MAEIETQKKTCKERVRVHYKGRMEDIRTLWELYKQDPEAYSEDVQATWLEYGLSFDYVPPYTWEGQKRGYWRYQLSWGGPSDEFRFYADENLKIDRVEYWFLDWWDGAKVIVSGGRLELLEEIWDDWKEVGTLEYTRKVAMEE